jgi:sugar lactone lactonase YvrE
MSQKLDWVRVTANFDTLGESPFWHPTEQLLYWVDILGKQIRRLDVESNLQESWAMPQDACCIAPAQSGGLVIALRDGFYRGKVWRGEVTPIATVGTGHFDFDTRTHRFNDGKCDSQGRFWCGTMNEPRTANDGVLYSLEMKAGQPIVKRQATGMTVSNGLAWSKDERTMYWSDSFGHTLHTFDWDAKSNELTNRRVLQDFPRKGEEAVYGGRPDGATMDANGNYYICLMEAGMLLKLSPDHKELARIPLPVGFATMPCFGGADLKTLFVTSLRENRTAEELAEQPDLGHVFSARTNVAGASVNFFAD